MKNSNNKTVQTVLDNRDLTNLSEGKAFQKYLKTNFADKSVTINVEAEYDKFLQLHPEYK